MRGSLLVAALTAAAVAGCAASPPAVQAPRPSIAPVPGGGRLLSDLGVRHGPPGFSLPAEFLGVVNIDDPKVVTLIVSAPRASELAAYLRTSLPPQGYLLRGTDPESLVFERSDYRGALTASEGVTGLTLRRVG